MCQELKKRAEPLPGLLFPGKKKKEDSGKGQIRGRHGIKTSKKKSRFNYHAQKKDI